MPRMCAVPDCPVRIEGSSRSGVCKKHLHHPTYCQCNRCMASEARPEAPVVRARVVMDRPSITGVILGCRVSVTADTGVQAGSLLDAMAERL